MGEVTLTLRVLIVNKFAHVTGGADRHSLELAQILRQDGHRVAFLSTASPRNVETDGAFIAPTVTSATRAELSYWNQARVAMSAGWNFQAARATSALIASFRPDVLHAHKLYPQLSVSPLAVAARRSIPIVQTLHDYEFIAGNPLDSQGRWFDRAEERLPFRILNSALYIERWALHRRLVDQWVSVSDAVSATHQSRGIEATTIRNFVLPCNDAVRPRDGREGLVYVGRLTPEKGSSVVIEVARRLRDVPMVVAGFGSDAPAMERAAKELPNLTYLGGVDPSQVSDVLGRAAVAIIPSCWEEPAGLTALEAMRAGTPIVAFRVGGLGEYVQGAGAGVVVAPNIDAALTACVGLLTDRVAWTAASNSGRNASTNEFGPARYLEQILDIYERLTSTGGSGKTERDIRR